MIKEYMQMAIGDLPLSSIVMVIFFILFFMIVVQTFRISKDSIGELSSIPLEENEKHDLKEGGTYV